MDGNNFKGRQRMIVRFGQEKQEGDMFSDFFARENPQTELPMPKNPVLGAGKGYCVESKVFEDRPFWKPLRDKIQKPTKGSK